jgi:hypothetical protein
LADDPANGIDRIWSAEEIREQRGFPEAAFLVAFKAGYELGQELSGPILTPPTNLGTHGYPPEMAAMRSSFFLVGPGVPAGRSVGEIDMRQIAPTLAQILHINLRDAELAPLALGSYK